MRIRRSSGDEDTTHVQCKRCEFWCDTSRDRIGPGSGMTYESVTHTQDQGPYKAVAKASAVIESPATTVTLLEIFSTG